MLPLPRLALAIVALATCAIPCAAQIPAGYYAPVDPTSATTLRTSVQALIRDHVRYPYTSSGTDTWNVLEAADEDPQNPNNILDLYRNQSVLKVGGGNAIYDREHTWPNSYGFPNDGGTNFPYTDCHALFLCDSSYNSSRGNNPYRACPTGCTERPTDLTNGAGGGSGVYVGNSNWRSGSGASGSWETWVGRRGDVARALMYLDVRYAGGLSGAGVPEPDLILTDNEALIAASNTGNNESVAYMGMLSVLLQWNAQDPPDAKERRRNDVVFGFQTNRNPFVDHPEWADCVFTGACATGAGFCFGDGSATACPCGNASGVGDAAGCRNSLGAGAKLTSMGHASLSNDTLVLTGRFMPNSSALYYQGDAQPGGGSGVTFGDGLRCAGGNVIRLAVKTNSVGASQYPDVADPRVSVKGGVVAAGTRHYQVWYRDAAVFCGASTFNLTNGWSVTWSP